MKCIEKPYILGLHSSYAQLIQDRQIVLSFSIWFFSVISIALNYIALYKTNWTTPVHCIDDIIMPKPMMANFPEHIEWKKEEIIACERDCKSLYIIYQSESGKTCQQFQRVIYHSKVITCQFEFERLLRNVIYGIVVLSQRSHGRNQVIRYCHYLFVAALNGRSSCTIDISACSR